MPLVPFAIVAVVSAATKAIVMAGVFVVPAVAGGVGTAATMAVVSAITVAVTVIVAVAVVSAMTITVGVVVTIPVLSVGVVAVLRDKGLPLASLFNKGFRTCQNIRYLHRKNY